MFGGPLEFQIFQGHSSLCPGATEGLFQNKIENHSRINTKITTRSENYGIILKNYIQLLSNNYNKHLNNVCNAKIKEITEIGNQCWT